MEISSQISVSAWESKENFLGAVTYQGCRLTTDYTDVTDGAAHFFASGEEFWDGRKNGVGAEDGSSGRK